MAAALSAVKQVYNVLEELGVKPLIELSLRPFLSGGDGYEFFDIRVEVPEKIVVIGGDGTLLRLLCNIGERGDPIIHPIKMGRKGYFFELDLYRGIEKLRDFVENRFWVEELQRLHIDIYHGDDENVYRIDTALNEAAIVSPGSKTITLRVEVDREVVYENLEGDGVVVATPAGSTAYSLSAGGPILDRSMEAIVVTPLNPLGWARSLVVSGSSRVNVLLTRSSRSSLLFIDGQRYHRLRPGEGFVARKSSKPARIARYGKRKRIALPW